MRGGGWSDEWEEREKVTLATVPVVGVYRMYTTSGDGGVGGQREPCGHGVCGQRCLYKKILVMRLDPVNTGRRSFGDVHGADAKYDVLGEGVGEEPGGSRNDGSCGVGSAADGRGGG
jgi:hypothetical protein